MYAKMNPTGYKGGFKGHKFGYDIADSIPGYMQNKLPEQIVAWCEQMNERYAIVQNCAICEEPLIKEEVLAHRLAHEHSTVRSLVGTVMGQPVDHQKRTLEVLKELIDVESV